MTIKLTNGVKKYLGIDWGEKRIGLALGDSDLRIAIPFKTVKNIKEIKEILYAEEITAIVLGKPLKMAHPDLPTAKEFNNFYCSFKKGVKAPIFIIDERLTSRQADALAGKKKEKAGRDAAAAMLILQVYLDGIGENNKN